MGAPSFAAFSITLPSSVKMYHAATTGVMMQPQSTLIKPSPSLSAITPRAISHRAATKTAAMLPSLCHRP